MALSSRARSRDPGRTRAGDEAGAAPSGQRRARRPSRAAGATAHLARTARWQVFGLAGAAPLPALPTGRRFPGPEPSASPAALQRGRTAVVPTYRCGAVPDSHRVPCCLREPGRPAEPAARNTICRRLPKPSTTCRAGVSVCHAGGHDPRRPCPQTDTAQAEWDERYASADQVWSGEPNGALVGEVAGLRPGRGARRRLRRGRRRRLARAARVGRDGPGRVRVALERAARHAAQAGVEVRVGARRAAPDAALAPGTFDLVSAQYPALLRTRGPATPSAPCSPPSRRAARCSSCTTT